MYGCFPLPHPNYKKQKLAFGVRFAGELELKRLKRPKPGQYDAEAIIYLTTTIFQKFFTPCLGAVFRLFWAIDPVVQETLKLNKEIHAYIDHMIAKWKRGEMSDTPMMDDIMREVEAGNLTEMDAKQIYLMMFIAGVDTVGNNILLVLQMMADKPGMFKSLVV